jgi:hypothetical protein
MTLKGYLILAAVLLLCALAGAGLAQALNPRPFRWWPVLLGALLAPLPVAVAAMLVLGHIERPGSADPGAPGRTVMRVIGALWLANAPIAMGIVMAYARRLGAMQTKRSVI